MNNIEHQVREKSLCRLAEIFNVGISELSDEIDLTTTFKASTVKFWKRNHFDMILDDIRDVAGKEMIKLLNKGEVEIKTVKDYVEFMIICYRKNPQLVELVLGEMKK
ncbi:hypothetical protein [Arsukibacterium perlucidum]|uniref:hypothetical protein n=1 Tax=Arsukibacterium perlucidum TaxID=368811 RepID=UPI00037A3F32|nr:hypothetical protein [Arsukibacterium perlucidum]